MTLTTAEMARILEHGEALGVAKCVEHMQKTMPEATAEVEAIGGARLINVGADSMTTTYGAGFDGPVDGAQVDHITRFFHDRGHPARVELCPYAHPTLIEALRARNYALEGFKDVLARPIDPDEVFSAPPEGVEIRAVDRDDPDDVSATAEAIAVGFNEGEDATPEEIRHIEALILQPQANAFTALMSGERVGGGIVAHEGRYAAFFAASTLPRARRRGVQTALLRARLELSRTLGADLATIQAKPGVGTRRNAERLGFALAYTRAVMILTTPEIGF